MTSFKLFNPIKRDVFTFLETRRKKQEERGVLVHGYTL